MISRTNVMKSKLLLFLLLNIPLLLSAQIQIVSNLDWRVGTQQSGPYNLPVYDVSDCTNEDYIDQACGMDYPSPNFPEHFAGCPDMIPIWGAPSPTTCNYAAFTDYWFHYSFDLDLEGDLCYLSSAVAKIQADQSFTLFINDIFVGSSTDSDWYLLFTFDVIDKLVDGSNDILIRTNNLDGGSCFNYAFAAFCLNIETAGNQEVTIINFENNLVSTTVFDTYQWVDCDNNFEAIDGATESTFTPTLSGNYALIATEGICVDTSDCLSYLILSSVSEPSEDCVRHSYPNPANDGSILLNIANNNGETTVAVYSVSGVLVFGKTFFSGSLAEVQLPEAEGIYFLKVRNGERECLLKVVRGK